MSKKRESDTKTQVAIPSLTQPAQHIIPVVIGSYARKLPMIPGYDIGQVYEWIVLLRSAVDPYLDLSPWIQSVEFTLHASFVEPIRTVTQPPFMVKEEGWGEFPVGIKIRFQASLGVPDVRTTHALKLISNDSVTVNERYDQICFANVSSTWPDDLDMPPLPVVSEFALEGRMYSFQDVCAVETTVAAELEYDAVGLSRSVASLQEQLHDLEERYLELKIRAGSKD